MASYSSITKMVEFWKLFSVSILVIEVKKAISRLDIKWSGKNGAAKMERQIFFVIKKILVLNLEGIQIKKTGNQQFNRAAKMERKIFFVQFGRENPFDNFCNRNKKG